MITAVPTRHIVLLQALRTAPARAAEVVASVPLEAHQWQPRAASAASAEAWSVHHLISHLMACEAPFLGRLARILQESQPWLPYFGPDVARPDLAIPLPEVLARFRAERDQLIAFLSSLTPDDWERPAIHETMGPTTLAGQVQNIVNHDSEHLEQLYELREAWQNHLHA